MIKAYAVVPGVGLDTVYEIMTNKETRRQWDKAISNFEVVEDFPLENRSILYYMIKTPVGISNRDFL